MIKYNYIKHNNFKKIFWIGSIIGALLYSISFYLYKNVEYSLSAEGLSYAGLAILAGIIGFSYGVSYKIKEEE